ncbi:DUF2971 domain-containing protein [Aliarcobacter butzleri]|uniref:DUF2971 domain-containing protein n=1 Tax=Aliarcobacter butzleri TaxID=28197 RepID=UPI00263C9A08|nr:DUF2971 domain-containing protein [Aliarcobacter butzleri]MDN5061334.1 DUF2971 domain-containing protein [Aliarcobacter butzleri]
MDELPKFLYKYRNFEDPYMINIIKNSSLYFSQVKNFNDPFDLRLDFKQSYTKQERLSHIKYLSKENGSDPNHYKKLKKKARDPKEFNKIKEESFYKVFNNISILSLSSDPKNILMWSHYAHNHTGLVFEFTEKFNSSRFLQIQKVKYKNDYSLLDLTKNTNFIKKEIGELLLTKYSDWQYEQEYRILNINDDPGEKSFNKLELTSIIFGLETANENIEMIKKLCAENGFGHVKFKRTEKVYGKFELKIVDLK